MEGRKRLKEPKPQPQPYNNLLLLIELLGDGLHHLQLLRIGQISGRRLISGYIRPDVNRGSVHQSLLEQKMGMGMATLLRLTSFYAWIIFYTLVYRNIKYKYFQ